MICFIACKNEALPVTENIEETNDTLHLAKNRLTALVDSAFKTGVHVRDSLYTDDHIYEDSKVWAAENGPDTLAPEVIYKAGALVKGHNNPTKAIGIWGLVTEQFPDSKYAAEALFQQAFTFDNDLKDKEMAKKYYRKFLEKYPKHKLTHDINLLLPMLDKTDAQLIEEFEKNSKK